MTPDFTNMPPLPILSKPERRKDCGACGSNIRGDRKARSSGLCYTCRRSIEHRGRPSVPEVECRCTCAKHHRFRTMDDGQCGGPVGGGRHTDCCFSGEDLGDPAFRALFNEYEAEFHRRVEAERERIRLEREERWAREEYLPGEVIAEARSLKANWTPEAVADLRKLWERFPLKDDSNE